MNLATQKPETTLNTLQAIELLIQKDQAGEIKLDGRAKHTFTRYIETERESSSRERV